ncbi:MAG: monofunctional biosynthetic peptidoglycan transglycosylase [Candidatus Binatia bacterium]
MFRRRSDKNHFRRSPSVVKRLIRLGLTIIIGGYVACALSLLYLKWLPPLTTGVQIQRRVESFVKWRPYSKRYTFVPLRQISAPLGHAAIAAEDARFFQHNGIDWVELGKVVEDARRSGIVARGASTITQQLVKNLFFTTHQSIVRKGIEFTLAPLAELILPKDRILELYLNVVEWGPGIYGAEAAAQFYYDRSAKDLSRVQAARLAACLPAPLERTPAEKSDYSRDILERMHNMGW